ncbi:MAG TPA: di-heme oxidoredictase family protein [Pyrinomonadaceae bacterium]|jgi:CxxC motif-containing protein (DUF1111 family)
MKRAKIFTLLVFLAAVVTTAALNRTTSSQTAAPATAAAAETSSDEDPNALPDSEAGTVDQANRASSSGVDVTEAQGSIDAEGAKPDTDANFSFNTESDPAAAGGSATAAPDKQASASANAICWTPFADAPADFDDGTNNFVSQTTFDADKDTFEERDEIADGLGPVYNAQACSECHQNPVTGAISQINELRAGHNRLAFNRQGQLVTVFADAPGGSLINDRSIPTKNSSTPPFFGAKVQERVPPLLTASIIGGPVLARDEPVRTFRTSLNTLGDGFLEAVPNGTLLAIANFQVAVTGGVVHGQAIAVPVLEANINTNPDCANPNLPCVRRIGRFGWKDQHASLLSFSGDAYLNEIGITNFLVRLENTSLGRSVAPFDPKPDPPPNGEDAMQDIKVFAEFMRATKAPPRDPDIINAFAASIARGRRLFASLPATSTDRATYSCSVCHVPAILTAPPCTVINGGQFTVPVALGNKIIRPFTDGLLHDVGTGDGIVQNGPQENTVPARLSTRNKLRTPPLWGVRTRDRLMHDGESLTFLEAILRHRGEALSVINRFSALPNESPIGTCSNLPVGCKEDVIRFLESL